MNTHDCIVGRPDGVPMLGPKVAYGHPQNAGLVDNPTQEKVDACLCLYASQGCRIVMFDEFNSPKWAYDPDQDGSDPEVGYVAVLERYGSLARMAHNALPGMQVGFAGFPAAEFPTNYAYPWHRKHVRAQANLLLDARWEYDAKAEQKDSLCFNNINILMPMIYSGAQNSQDTGYTDEEGFAVRCRNILTICQLWYPKQVKPIVDLGVTKNMIGTLSRLFREVVVWAAKGQNESVDQYATRIIASPIAQWIGL